MEHGVSVSIQPTSNLAPAVVSGSVPVVFGTAPVHLATQAAPVNTPVRISSYAEAVAALGYSDDWASYTLCEFIYSHFQLYAQAPVVLVNVLDPATHKAATAPPNVVLLAGAVTLADDGILLPSLVVKSADGNTTYTRGTQYTAAYNKAGRVIVTTVGNTISPTATLKVTYDKLTPAAVDADDVIGGVDVNGHPSGLELVNQVFPRFGIVPGLLLAPGFSHNPTVAAVLKAKAGNINGHFRALALTDVDTAAVTNYNAVTSWKNTNSYTGLQVVAWPKLKQGARTFHFSTHLAGVICQTDASNGGTPHYSPSNKPLQVTGAVLQDGAEVFLGPDQAGYLNEQGIVTAINFAGGWRTWGNRLGTFPASSDPVETFISVRRVFNWIANTIILTYWQQVDSPATHRLIETITDSVNIWLNGLQAAGVILGGRLEFLAAENPNTAVQEGKIKFHLYLTPPSPAEEISFVLEYDPAYLAALTA